MRNLLLASAVLFSASLSALTFDFDGLSVFYGEIPNAIEIESHPYYDNNSSRNLRNNLFDLNGTLTFAETSGSISDNLLSVDLNLTMYEQNYSNLDNSIIVNFDSFDFSASLDTYSSLGTYSVESYFGNSLAFKFDYQDVPIDNVWFEFSDSMDSNTNLFFDFYFLKDPDHLSLLGDGLSFGGDYFYQASYDHYVESSPLSSSTSYYPVYYVFNVVPEPSTYALIFGGLALGFVAIRRK